MRIAFIGKGGSGKTTLTAAFCEHSRKKGLAILGFDVDVNTHLHEALGFKSEPRALIPRAQEVFRYLEPDRPEFHSKLDEIPFIGCLPPAKSSRFVKLDPSDPIFQQFGLSENGMLLLTAGTYASHDIGVACYHGKLFSSQLVAHRILDDDNSIIAFDATAGTDPVATSLFVAYDMHLVIVEPTAKSVQVYTDYLEALPFEVPVFVVANKIRSQTDREFLNKFIPADKIIGEIPFSADLKRFEQGDRAGMSRFVDETAPMLDKILAQLRQCKRPRATYYRLIQAWFEKYSARWYDPVYKTTLGELSREQTEILVS